MCIALHCKEQIPELWYYDKDLKNKNGQTVRDILR